MRHLMGGLHPDDVTPGGRDHSSSRRGPASWARFRWGMIALAGLLVAGVAVGVIVNVLRADVVDCNSTTTIGIHQATASVGSEGSRANPGAICSTVISDDWTIAIDEFDPGAGHTVNGIAVDRPAGTMLGTLSVTTTYTGPSPADATAPTITYLGPNGQGDSRTLHAAVTNPTHQATMDTWFVMDADDNAPVFRITPDTGHPEQHVYIAAE